MLICADNPHQGSGNAEGWGTAVECQVDACTGTVAAHGKNLTYSADQHACTSSLKGPAN